MAPAARWVAMNRACAAASRNVLAGASMFPGLLCGTKVAIAASRSSAEPPATARRVMARCCSLGTRALGTRAMRWIDGLPSDSPVRNSHGLQTGTYSVVSNCATQHAPARTTHVPARRVSTAQRLSAPVELCVDVVWAGAHPIWRANQYYSEKRFQITK